VTLRTAVGFIGTVPDLGSTKDNTNKARAERIITPPKGSNLGLAVGRYISVARALHILFVRYIFDTSPRGIGELRSTNTPRELKERGADLNLLTLSLAIREWDSHKA
jgi:hypothetical protein